MNTLWFQNRMDFQLMIFFGRKIGWIFKKPDVLSVKMGTFLDEAAFLVVKTDAFRETRTFGA